MIVMNLGRRYQGKTTLGLYMMRKFPIGIVLDPRGLVPSKNRVTNLDALHAAFDEIIVGERSQVVVTPDELVQPMFLATMTRLRDVAMRGQSFALLLDEVRFMELGVSPSLDWLLRCTKPDDVCVVFTAHRPADIPVDIRSISDLWCIFQMTQEHDLKVVAERCSPKVASIVAGLKPREFVAWNDMIGNYEVHRHPDRWRMDLANTGGAASGRAAPLADLRGEPASTLTGRPLLDKLNGDA